MPQLLLDGQSLTIENVVSVAYGAPGDPDVQLSQPAVQLVQRAADAVQTLLERATDKGLVLELAFPEPLPATIDGGLPFIYSN